MGLKKMPRVLAVHDISCFGKCSLTICLPVISTFGVEVCPLPTAMLSTNTSFDEFEFVDFTNEMERFILHWKKIGLKFDALYSGFLGSTKQIEYIKEISKEFNIKNVIIDPVMGDNGVTYKTYTKEMCENMKSLVSYADILMPNLTESCILTDEKYPQTDIKKLAQKIQNLGAKNVIIKGIERGDKLYNCILTKENEYIERQVELLPFKMHGTGDLFGSVITGALNSGSNLIEAVDKAARFVIEVMEYSKTIENYQERGTCFEPLLHKLNDNYRYEVINGVLYVMESPSFI